MSIKDLYLEQQAYFKLAVTQTYRARLTVLSNLQTAFDQHEPELYQALLADLGKDEFESYVSEISQARRQIQYAIRHLKRWMAPKRAASNWYYFAKSSIHAQPLGQVLIISPFNYPVLLPFAALVSAIAAGNTVMLKPSEAVPHCNKVLAKIFSQAVSPSWLVLVEGGKEVVTELLALRFDHIHFTGSAAVGRIVMRAASEFLTPVTLELGGKSPVIVDESANIAIAAQRILWAKILNAGQTCIAPDYVLVHQSVQAELVAQIQALLTGKFRHTQHAQGGMTKMIHDAHFQKVQSLLQGEKIIAGGEYSAETRFIALTLLDDITLDSPCMQTEIFGPILPILSYQHFDQIQTIVEATPQHPLACYFFSENKAAIKKLIKMLPFGGGCINHCLLHITNYALPFGGVGQSGFGASQGKAGFDSFSHLKGMMRFSSKIEHELSYPPYSKFKLSILKRLLK